MAMMVLDKKESQRKLNERQDNTVLMYDARTEK